MMEANDSLRIWDCYYLAFFLIMCLLIKDMMYSTLDSKICDLQKWVHFGVSLTDLIYDCPVDQCQLGVIWWCISLLGLLYVTECYKWSGLNKIYFLEARSLKLVCRQVWFLLKALRQNMYHFSLLTSGSLLAIFNVAWLVDPYISVFIFTQHPFYMCMSLCPDFLFLYEPHLYWSKPHSNDLILTGSSANNPFPNKVMSTGTRVRTSGSFGPSYNSSQ